GAESLLRADALKHAPTECTYDVRGFIRLNPHPCKDRGVAARFFMSGKCYAPCAAGAGVRLRAAGVITRKNGIRSSAVIRAQMAKAAGMLICSAMKPASAAPTGSAP